MNIPTPSVHDDRPAAAQASPGHVELGPVAEAPGEAAEPKTEEADPFLVVFAQPYDAANPLDWPAGRKWMVTDVLSATGFNRIMVSTIMAPALPAVAAELAMGPAEAAMALSIYLLATAFGPLVIGPLSELYGRRRVLHASNLWFLAWNLLCGFAADKATLIAARFLAGFGASAVYALAGGVLADVWRPEQRGKSLGVYLLIPLLGAAVGPIIGGFMAARVSWRWMFWATSIFQGAMIAVSLFSFPETYGPAVLRRRAARLRRTTGDARYHTPGERQDGARPTTAVLGRALSRPLRLLAAHPIIQVAAALAGFSYGLLYLVLSTFATLWVARYDQSVEASGLHYIACSLGELAASQLGGYAMDRRYRRQAARGRAPEARIPLMVPGLVAAWAGMLLYGWAATAHLHWAVVDLGVFVMLFGMQLSDMPLTAYVLDAYSEHTSSALAAEQLVKSLTAFLFPLFAPSMYDALGYGWSNSILALVGVVLTVPLALFVWKYGARLRAKAGSTY